MADGSGNNYVSIQRLNDGARPEPKDILMAYNEAKSIRSPYEQDWKMNAAFCLPRHYSGWLSEGPTMNAPQSRDVKRYAYDATAARALPKWSAILRRLATPDGHKWQRLTPSNPDLLKSYDVRAYFDAVTDLLFTLRYDPRALFSQTCDETYLGLGCYGTAPIRIKWRDKKPTDQKGGLAFKAMPLKDMFPLADGDGIIDTMFVRLWYTAPQVKKMFPASAYADCASIQRELSKAVPSNSRYFEIVHAVFPRDANRYDPTTLTVNRHPFVGCFIHVEDACYIGPEDGFASFPYLVPRTATEPGQLFGFSPAQQASPAMGTVNAMKKTMLRVAQKKADPTLLASDDGVLSGRLGLTPGYVNYGAVNSQGVALVKPLDVGDLNPAKDILADERGDIDDAFLVNLFQILIETPEMTATEVIERVAEKAALAAPTMARLQGGFLGPEVERDLALINENAPYLMPVMPPELIEARGEYEIVYTSPLAKGLHAEEDSGFLYMVQSSIEVATATGDPSALDHYNFDVAIPELAEHRSVPTRWMHTPEELQAIRDDRKNQQAQAQIAQAAPSIAKIAVTGRAPQPAIASQASGVPAGGAPVGAGGAVKGNYVGG
jgi:hypothetical protein